MDVLSTTFSFVPAVALSVPGALGVLRAWELGNFRYFTKEEWTNQCL